MLKNKNNSVKRILEVQRKLSGMAGQFNSGRPGRRPAKAARLKILEIWANPPVPAKRGRPSFFSLRDKYQGKFDF